MRKLWLFFGIAIVISHCPVQGQSWELEHSQELQAESIVIDALGTLYWLHQGALYAKTSDQQTRMYSNRQLGPIRFLDVSDPLHILVFFEQNGTLVFLDRHLAEKAVIPTAHTHTEEQAAMACSSQNQGFWIFQPAFFRLQKRSSLGRVETTSNDLSLLRFPLTQALWMREADGWLWVSDGQTAVWVFDRYGGFRAHIPLAIASNGFQVSGNTLFFLQGADLVVYDFFLQVKNVILLPEKDVQAFFLKGDHLYLLTTGELKKYRHLGNIF